MLAVLLPLLEWLLGRHLHLWDEGVHVPPKFRKFKCRRCEASYYIGERNEHLHHHRGLPSGKLPDEINHDDSHGEGSQ